MRFSAVIHSFRLRTLPLSLSGTLLGVLWAYHSSLFSWPVALCALGCTVSLQILSNLCNEWGDWQKGTDVNQQVRPAFSLQQGALTLAQMKRVIYVMAAVAALLGVGAVYLSFGTLFSLAALALLALGALSLTAAVTYTVGKHPYGYHCLGDLSVFLFFGLAAVAGTFFLLTHTLPLRLLLPASALGLLITGVLNTNNIRDIENDLLHHKHTVAAALGTTGAKCYQTALVFVALFLMLCFAGLSIRRGAPLYSSLLFLLSLGFFIPHLIVLWRSRGKAVDRAFKLLIPGILIFALCGGCMPW